MWCEIFGWHCSGAEEKGGVSIMDMRKRKIPKLKIVKLTLGVCPCCKRKTLFIAYDYWFRDCYRCLWCLTVPRERAVMKVLKDKRPEYAKLKIHECSPGKRTRRQLMKECEDYTFSFFYDNVCLGKIMENGASNQNLENMTFEDNTFDIFITQDVMEHINDPMKAFSEIARVLKPGGVHIFTTPIYHFQKTRARIAIENEKVVNILPAVYHGDPINEEGCLVTYDWGYDIAEFIENASRMKSEIIEFKKSKYNYRRGLDADFLEVIVSYKV